MERAIGSVRVTVFGRLAELSLSSCCPRLRLRAVRRLALHTLDHLEVLDINGVDDLEALDVSAPKPPVPEPERPLLLPPSPRRVSRPPAGTAATRSISPFRSGLARVRRLDGPLKLAVVRRRDQFDRRPLHHAAPAGLLSRRRPSRHGARDAQPAEADSGGDAVAGECEDLREVHPFPLLSPQGQPVSFPPDRPAHSVTVRSTHHPSPSAQPP
ncbi:Os12g0606701 [Oryza sativa Japonica Group]|uniref:Os12g0606701 protein n=1 Tax=Oryza sativa subsp. japonica TaxID=39947 RepID=A0A0P0YBY9_ORYSJ|nr:Os12g0606701 [Oryza sativa Japonica Group]